MKPYVHDLERRIRLASMLPPPTGHLRVRVDPTTAQVYVDGFYMGTVEDVNGSVQDVNLEAGPHRIEIPSTLFDAFDDQRRLDNILMHLSAREA